MKKSVLITAAFAMTAFAVSAPVTSQENQSVQTQATENTGFTKRRYKISGNWSIETENGQTTIRFDDTFKTKGGPDLKLFISPVPLADFSGNSLRQGARKIGILKSNKGAQSYVIPNDISLSDYKSIVIHCEAFSVVWGGFDL